MTWYEEDDENIVVSESDTSDTDKEYQPPKGCSDIGESSSDSEAESIPDHNSPSSDSNGTFIGRNNFSWNSTQLSHGRVRSHNIVRFTSGPQRRNQVWCIKNAWDKFITPEIVYELILCTNREAKREFKKMGRF